MSLRNFSSTAKYINGSVNTDHDRAYMIITNNRLETLSKEEINRYSRHLQLSEVGLEGQKRLKAAHVLIVGAGGLGSPVILYLAAAGVGTLGIVDFDIVEESNLQRQVIHSISNIGKSKVASAKERVAAINPSINIKEYNTLLNRQNAIDIIKDYDLVAETSDNYPTRYLINDVTISLGIPYVYGSIFQFEGQASIFNAKEGPCYRCLYPSPPPIFDAPFCQETGVMGVLPGIVGCIQAAEIVKLIIGGKNTLIGRLLLIDTWKMKFRELKIDKNSACSICGKNPTNNNFIDYA